MKNKSGKKSPEAGGLKAETKNSVFAVLFFVLAVFFLLAMFGLAGVAGRKVHQVLEFLLGVGYILLPVLLVLLGVSLIQSKAPEIGWTRAGSGILFLLSGLGLVDIVSGTHAGGLLGKILPAPLLPLFDVYASIAFLGAILIISILIIFDAKPNLANMAEKLAEAVRKTLRRKQAGEDAKKSEEKEARKNAGEAVDESVDKDIEINGAGAMEEKKDKQKKESPAEGRQEKKEKDEDEEINFKKFSSKHSGSNSNYVPPPLSLLEEDQGKPNVGDIKANANIIKRTLGNFGIEVEMDEVTVGPTVSRYALKPAEGVKLSRIVGLQNDLALSLAAHPIRIEAPIPGKSLVGVEIPNRSKSIVGLATLLRDEKFQHAPAALTMALGREISGRAVFGNLSKMPHCLVAGATGAGKSVTIHALITSLLYRNSPDNLKFILVDPKRVELTLYNGIPHLLTPVITEAKKAILALKWAAKEMDRRYDILEAESVRDIDSYHANVFGRKSGKESEKTERLPYIVIIIDELADIMNTYPRELEAAIVRLAQMSRAVGIHLILSTQRPEVNVITGLIKANIPTRIALKVSSQVDSRTILDQGGAEKLLGAGDMLYSSGERAPERLQSAFISETEVKKVVKHLKDEYRDEPPVEISLSNGSVSADKSIFESTLENEEDGFGDDDEMYEEARACVIEAGKASTSYLQRKLKLGYARAARLMDMLEERGVIGPGEGAKPREVLKKIARDENGNNLP